MSKRKNPEPSQDHRPRAMRRLSDPLEPAPPLPSPIHDLSKNRLDLPQADVVYIPNLFPPDDCAKYYRELLALPDWIQPILTVFGRKKLQSRKVCVFGDPRVEFRYSGATIDVSDKYPDSVSTIQTALEERLGTVFNTVLLNMYEDGSVYIGAHSDDVKGHKEGGAIATKRTKFILPEGSVLVMKGDTQKYYKHEIPKDPTVTEGRISLTYRQRNVVGGREE
ncbi:hypothetical protein BC938DRAFT_479871 [Jimgerdemannia flammicorona]|uniref:Alpha-ketoglutarate-dependent dioxygenase AlkB-like domain-containing protein n=1 Tax=Jimgerdemannia flammicorona TaxID=994334 RepID=A0A433QJZ5_9FUNG|nr:hypothetical protein BC938DRAFT_479871 [Jimgerdemannia flammicorona]